MLMNNVDDFAFCLLQRHGGYADNNGS